MKTTVGNVCDAYKALTKLLLQEIPLKQGIGLFHLKGQLRETFEFACVEERKLQDAFGAEDQPNGKIRFPSADRKERYFDKIRELLETEVELEVAPVDITALSGSTMINIGALEGFVTF